MRFKSLVKQMQMTLLCNADVRFKIKIYLMNIFEQALYSYNTEKANEKTQKEAHKKEVKLKAEAWLSELTEETSELVSALREQGCEVEVVTLIREDRTQVNYNTYAPCFHVRFKVLAQYEGFKGYINPFDSVENIAKSLISDSTPNWENFKNFLI